MFVLKLVSHSRLSARLAGKYVLLGITFVSPVKFSYFVSALPLVSFFGYPYYSSVAEQRIILAEVFHTCNKHRQMQHNHFCGFATDERETRELDFGPASLQLIVNL
jgi:hypothetical protein